MVEQKFCTMRERQRERERKEEEDHTINLQFNVTFYSIFSKLKNILAAINFLLKPDKINSWALENVSKKKIEPKLKDILLKAKVPQLKLKRVYVLPAINQDVKFANILPKHISLNHCLQSLYIPSYHRIWIALQKTWFVFLEVKPDLNTQRNKEFCIGFNSYIYAERNFFWTRKLSKAHVTLISLYLVFTSSC